MAVVNDFIKANKEKMVEFVDQLSVSGLLSTDTWYCEVGVRGLLTGLHDEMSASVHLSVSVVSLA